jgi:hypothetical protein
MMKHLIIHNQKFMKSTNNKFNEEDADNSFKKHWENLFKEDLVHLILSSKISSKPRKKTKNWLKWILKSIKCNSKRKLRNNYHSPIRFYHLKLKCLVNKKKCKNKKIYFILFHIKMVTKIFSKSSMLWLKCAHNKNKIIR